MFSLEELTKDELIEWIRKNEPEIDEGEIVKQTLIQRIEYAFEKSTSFFERHKEVSSKASELINPYIPDGAKGGMRIYNVPADVIQRYQALDKERKDLWTEYGAWNALGREASEKIAQFAAYQLEQKQKQSYGGK